MEVRGLVTDTIGSLYKNMETFKIKKYITSSHKDCNSYLLEIHEYIEELFENPNYKLIEAYRDFTNSVATDMKNIAKGDFEELTILSNSKDDKAFDRAMLVLKSVDSFDKVAKMMNDFKPVIEDIKEDGRIKHNLDLSTIDGGLYEALQKNKRAK